MTTSDEHFDLELQDLRAYLVVLIESSAPKRLRGKLDASAIVQESLLEVARQHDDGRLGNVKDLRAYTRRIASGNLTDAIRKLGAAKRDVGREVSLDQRFEDVSGAFAEWLADSQLTPSRVAINREAESQAARVLLTLNAEQRMAITLHHLRGMTLQQTAMEMNKSKASVASLIFRGLRAMREQLADWER